MPAIGANLIIGGSAPHLRQEWFQDFDAWWDFQNNIGTGAALTDTHAQAILADSVAGVYTSFGANVLPRTDRGLETVPNRQQLITNPINFAASWNPTRCTVSADATTAPDGTMTADKVTEDNTAAATHVVFQGSPSLTSGTTYTVQVCAKAAERSRINLNFATTRFPDNALALFDLANGTIISQGAGAVSSSILPLTNGWYLCSVTAVCDSTGANNTLINLVATTNNNYNGDGVSGLYLWGATLFAGAHPIPPILTTATIAGNRPRLEGISASLANGVAGFIQFDFRGRAAGPSVYQLMFSDGTINNAVRMDCVSGNGNFRWVVTNGGVADPAMTIAASVEGVSTIAFAVGPNYARARIVGGADVAPDTSVTYPTLDRMAIGGAGIADANQMYGFTRKLALKFGAPDNDVFNAMFQRAQLAAAA